MISLNLSGHWLIPLGQLPMVEKGGPHESEPMGRNWAILARPASTVRAGEERWVVRTLGNLGIPVLKVFTGTATFEGADFMWVDPRTAVLGRGLRTNQTAIDQITSLLSEMGISTLAFDLSYGCMHFMGMLRSVDRNLAFVWPRRTPHGLVMILQEKGYQVLPLPDPDEAIANMSFNFVVMGKKIMLPAKTPEARPIMSPWGWNVFPFPWTNSGKPMVPWAE